MANGSCRRYRWAEGGSSVALVVCQQCQRHVKRADSVCPFCGAPVLTALRAALGASLVLGMGLAVASCSGEGSDPSSAAAYGPPPCNGAPCPTNQVLREVHELVAHAMRADGGRWLPGRARVCLLLRLSRPRGPRGSPVAQTRPSIRCVDLPEDGYHDLCSSVCDGGAACEFQTYVMCTLN